LEAVFHNIVVLIVNANKVLLIGIRIRNKYNEDSFIICPSMTKVKKKPRFSQSRATIIMNV
jgi:hypothetical protein